MEDMEQQPPQELLDWWNRVCEIGIDPESGKGAPKSNFITAYRADGTSKQFRSSTDLAEAEQQAQLLWNTNRWTRIEINGKTRYE